MLLSTTDMKVAVVVTAIDHASEVFDRLGGHAVAMSERFQHASTTLRMAGGAMMAAGAAVGGALAYSVREAADFESAITEVSTLVDTSEVDMNRLAAGVRQVGAEVGKSAVEMSRGLYQVISAGIDAADALDVLRVAARAAVAGVTDTYTAVDGLTTVLNAFGVAAKDAGSIADQMFTTVRLGKTTFGELAAQIGTVAPAAAAAGLSTEELFASIATLTQGGINTAEATTYLRQTIMSIVQPSQQAAKAAQELGIQFGAEALQSKGLFGVLEDVKRATGGNVEAMARLFPNIRAVMAVLALTGPQAAQFRHNLDEMRHAAGATDEAFSKMGGTLRVQLGRLRESFRNVAIEVGLALLPAIKAASAVLTGISQAFAWLQQHLPGVGPALAIAAAAFTAVSIPVGALLFALPSMIQGFLVLQGVLTSEGTILERVAQAWRDVAAAATQAAVAQEGAGAAGAAAAGQAAAGGTAAAAAGGAGGLFGTLLRGILPRVATVAGLYFAARGVFGGYAAGKRGEEARWGGFLQSALGAGAVGAVRGGLMGFGAGFALGGLAYMAAHFMGQRAFLRHAREFEQRWGELSPAEQQAYRQMSEEERRKVIAAGWEQGRMLLAARSVTAAPQPQPAPQPVQLDERHLMRAMAMYGRQMSASQGLRIPDAVRQMLQWRGQLDANIHLQGDTAFFDILKRDPNARAELFRALADGLRIATANARP